MRVQYSDLKKKRVLTESDAHLGKVIDCVVEAEGFCVTQLVVKKLFSTAECTVAPHQIKRITSQTIVVDDAVVLGGEVAANTSATIDPEPALMSEIE